MTSIECFQYIPCSKPAALSRLLRRLVTMGCMPILDLEDSVQNTLNPELTPALKQEARDSFVDLVLRGKIDPDQALGLRINARTTSEYARDLAMLDQVKAGLHLHSVWLPMAETAETLIEVYDEIVTLDVTCQQIIPIVETRFALNNLNDICTAKERMPLGYIHYGHYDYSLDSGHWPLLEQDDVDFWDIVEPLISSVEANGLTYIHSPFGNLDDDALFYGVSGHLERICTKPFGRAALNLHQSQLILNHQESDFAKRPHHFTDDEKLVLAKKTVETFQNNQASRRSYSVHERKFITPHEYRLAKLYLAANDVT